MCRPENKCIRIDYYAIANNGIFVLQSSKRDAVIDGCFVADFGPLSNDDALWMGEINPFTN